jgi:hypothetical protein
VKGQKVEEEQTEPQYLSPEDAALLSLPEHLRYYKIIKKTSVNKGFHTKN